MNSSVSLSCSSPLRRPSHPTCLFTGILLIWLVFLPRWALTCCHLTRTDLATTFGQHCYSSLLLLYLLYPSTCQSIVVFFNCLELPDPYGTLLLTDVRVQCTDEMYQIFFWAALAAVFVYPIGIPLLYFVLLSRSCMVYCAVSDIH